MTTLRDYVKHCLESLLEWAKANRDYWGKIQEDQKREFDFQFNFVKYRFDRFMGRFWR